MQEKKISAWDGQLSESFATKHRIELKTRIDTNHEMTFVNSL